MQVSMSKEKWKAYYEVTLVRGLTTLNGLKQKFDEYKEKSEEWSASKNAADYENSQAALAEILEENGMLAEFEYAG